MRYVVFVKTINNRMLNREFETADDMKKYITKKYKDDYAIAKVRISECPVTNERVNCVHMRTKKFVTRMIKAGFEYYNHGVE